MNGPLNEATDIVVLAAAIEESAAKHVRQGLYTYEATKIAIDLIGKGYVVGVNDGRAQRNARIAERAERAEETINAALDHMFTNAEPKPAYDDCDCGCTEDYVSVSTMKRILAGG